jgi:hypothetical protein
MRTARGVFKGQTSGGRARSLPPPPTTTILIIIWQWVGGVVLLPPCDHLSCF